MDKKRRKKEKSLIFSQNLKAIIEERKLTQKKAAELMEVSVSVVHDWLQGTYPNDPLAILRFCHAVGCDFQWLLTGELNCKDTSPPPITQLFKVTDDINLSGMFIIKAQRLEKK